MLAMVASVPDVIFRSACAFHGLRCGFPRLRCFSLMFWFLTASVFPYAVGSYFYAITFGSADIVSLSEVTYAAGASMYLVSTYCSLYIFVLKRESIEGLLQRNSRKPMDVLLPLLCLIPHIGSTVYSIASMTNFGFILSHACFIIGDLSMMTFFMVYLDMINNLISRLQNLHKLSTKVGRDWNLVVLEKWRIRDAVQTINSFYSLPLSLHHFQLFISSTFYLKAIIGDLFGVGMVKLFYLITAVSINAPIVIAAWKASTLVSHCYLTENHLLKLCGTRSWGSRDRDLNCGYARVLQFREDWDSLRVACFIFSKENILKFLSTMVTCVAVVMQFDFKVSRALATLAVSMTNSEVLT